MIKDRDFSKSLVISEHYSFESISGIIPKSSNISEFLKHFLYTSSYEVKREDLELDRISNVKVSFKMLPNYKDVIKYKPKTGTRVTADYKEDNGEIEHIDIFFNDQDFGWRLSNNNSVENDDESYSDTPISIFTLLYWLSKNYKFDKDNFVIEKPIDDIKTTKITFYDFEDNKDIVLGYYPFVDYFCEKDLIRLRLLEKISRFCQYPCASADKSNTPWNSFELMQKFKENGGNFSELIFKTLDNVDCLVNKGRTPDHLLRDRMQHQEFNFKFLNRINSKYLNNTIAVNPFEVTDMKSFQRIIDTYSQVTTLESEGREFESKYILVPCYFEIFVIDCSLVNRTLYDKFKLGNKTLKDAIYYEANGKTYALIKNDIH